MKFPFIFGQKSHGLHGTFEIVAFEVFSDASMRMVKVSDFYISFFTFFTKKPKLNTGRLKHQFFATIFSMKF